MLPITPSTEIQKILKDRGHYSGPIDGIQDEDYMAGVERWLLEMGVVYAGWPKERKLIAAEELLYETQGIDVGKIDGVEDHQLQYAREAYKAKNFLTWRDKAEEISAAIEENKGSEWAKKYTLTQNAVGATPEQYDAYRQAVGYIESRNNPKMGAGGAGGHYWGMYQFGTAATQDTSAFLRDSADKEDFEDNQDLAEKHFDALSYLNNRYLSRNEKYVALSPVEKLAVLGYAHNQGAGGASKWLNTGVAGHDAFGTSGAKYYNAILEAMKKIKTVIVPPTVTPDTFSSGGTTTLGKTSVITPMYFPTPLLPRNSTIEAKITSKVVYIGDSVAVGLQQANNDGEGFAKIGMGPKAILNMIATLNPDSIRNKVVILSAGLLNNITDSENVKKIIQYLKSNFCEVSLVGGPNPDWNGVNSKLQQIAKEEAIKFLGSYEPDQDGIHPKNYKAYKLDGSIPEQDDPTNGLGFIHIYQLAFLRGIGQTETGWSRKEAYSEAYNKPSNNRNVREYGQDGADYGYFQCNAFDVKDAIRKGVPPDIAQHINGGGRDGKSTVAEQTIAMHHYLSKSYPAIYSALKTGSPSAREAAIDTMDGKWFGLKDRPAELRKIWASVDAYTRPSDIFPEVAASIPQPKPEVPVQVTVVPKPTTTKIVWPKQSACSSFYGDVGTQQVKCIMPFPLVLAWDTGTSLNSYSCHKLVKEPMERIWNRTFQHYGYEKIRELRLHYFGGCLNVRKMRGGSNWSMHSWGIAVDIDPDRNSLNTSWANAQMSKPDYKKFVEFWYDEGAINLGVERDFDPMHFQFARL